MTEYKGRVESLPKWAQDALADHEMENGRLRSRLLDAQDLLSRRDVLTKGGDQGLLQVPYSWREQARFYVSGHDRAMPLMVGDSVGLWLGKRFEMRVSLAYGQGKDHQKITGLRVNSDGPLVILPEASNCARVAPMMGMSDGS